MKVIHQDQEHLVSFSSDEVALLLHLCFAGACSDLLPSTNSAKTRVRRSSRSGWPSGVWGPRVLDQRLP